MDIKSKGPQPARKGYTLVPCPGAAHTNPFIDNCMTCAPRWGWAEVPEGVSTWEEHCAREDAEWEAKKAKKAPAALCAIWRCSNPAIVGNRCAQHPQRDPRTKPLHFAQKHGAFPVCGRDGNNITRAAALVTCELCLRWLAACV